ncbi:uncharacterized protein LOC114383920 [Glycine soja]|uniref:uncharacterized protein n=1 Tax=Glycine max TaxID=3847 RepID=UPI0003DEAC8C|nr:uncharacterized protein LOC102659378 [Glycine max]XP_028199423.1 uncharacterized protein LOC114383920 [Glycine soja]|eukprot:XP_006596740.1 uncharacterized protein LOC102659378 [Glycine max]
MATVQHLVIANRKRRPIICRIKADLNKTFKEITKAIEVAQINIPFPKALEKIPTHDKFMKDLLTKKRRIMDDETVELELVGKALLDLGASINLIPLSMIKQIEVEIRPTRKALQFVDKIIKNPYGIVEDVLVKVDKFVFPINFVVMDMEGDSEVPLILGKPFIKTAKVMIDVDDGKLIVGVQDDEV